MFKEEHKVLIQQTHQKHMQLVKDMETDFEMINVIIKAELEKKKFEIANSYGPYYISSTRQHESS
jgi:hypothetical protein